MSFRSWATATLAVAAASTTLAAPDISGSGHIILTDGQADQDDVQRIGCLSADGFAVLDDCGVFSDLETEPKSDAGVCNFNDEAQPLNVDSYYGSDDHAFHCWADGAANDPWNFFFYSINGFSYPYLCYGNIDCYIDLPGSPSQGSKLPVWPFVWGSQQIDVAEGHVRARMMWEQI